MFSSCCSQRFEVVGGCLCCQDDHLLGSCGRSLSANQFRNQIHDTKVGDVRIQGGTVRRFPIGQYAFVSLGDVLWDLDPTAKLSLR
jgi:hypothetical protein